MRQLFLTVGLLAWGLLANAQSANRMVLRWSAGGSGEPTEKSFALNDLRRICFDAESGNVTLLMNDGEETAVNDNDAWSALFATAEEKGGDGDETSIGRIEAGATESRIYNIDGIEVRRGSESIGRLTDGLPHGLYIVRSGQRVQKIIL